MQNDVERLREVSESSRFVLCSIHEESVQVYGDVFTVWLPHPHVVLLSYSAIKEAFIVRGESGSLSLL